MPEQKLVHIGLYPDDLDRLDAWAKERGIPRNQAVVALLNIVTGVSETREQKLARAKGLLARGPIPDDYNHPDPNVAEPDGRFEGRVIDKDPEFQQ